MPETLRNEDLFRTDNAALMQCDRTETFFLSLGGEDIEFRFCDLLAFRKKLLAIDLAELLDSETPDIEIIHLKHCDRVVVLGIKDILDLGELFAGAFTMLELNSLLHRYLYRNPF
jgi:hypothetical protein